MRRYILAPEAKEDLKQIKAYLQREAGLPIAQSTMKKIRDALHSSVRHQARGMYGRT